MRPADRVMQSYGRCCASDTFFDDFYEQFLSSSPEIADKFKKTDMPAQKHLLRAGILNLVLHARGMPDTKLRALGESHSRSKLDIRPELYGLWVGALLSAVRRHDSKATGEDLEAWEQVLNQGISIIKAGY